MQEETKHDAEIDYDEGMILNYLQKVYRKRPRGRN